MLAILALYSYAQINGEINSNHISNSNLASSRQISNSLYVTLLGTFNLTINFWFDSIFKAIVTPHSTIPAVLIDLLGVFRHVNTCTALAILRLGTDTQQLVPKESW